MSSFIHDIRRLLGRRDTFRLGALLVCLWVNFLFELACLTALPAFIQILFKAGGMSVHNAGDALALGLAAFLTGRLGLEATPQNMTIATGAALLLLNALRTGWMYFSISLQERFLANRKIEYSGRLVEGYLAADAEFRAANPDTLLVNRWQSSRLLVKATLPLWAMTRRNNP